MDMERAALKGNGRGRVTEAARRGGRGREGWGEGGGNPETGTRAGGEPGGRGARPGVQAGASVQSGGRVLLQPRSPWPGGGGKAASPVYVFF